MSDAPETKVFSQSKGLKKLPPMSCPGHKHKYETTNATFAKNDGNFINACSKAGVQPTTRQASKWRNKTGLAYMQGRLAQ